MEAGHNHLKIFTILSADEVQARLAGLQPEQPAVTLVNPHHLRLLVESARIRLACSHDRQFAVFLSGICTLPHQIEAIYDKMLAATPVQGKRLWPGCISRR